MTSNVPDLPVPDEALDVFRLELGEHHGVHGSECVRAIAAPMIAAELRRLVAEHGGMTRGGDLVIDATVLTDRADELDPEKKP